MSFKIEGFDKLERELKNMAKKAQELDGKHEVSFGILFNDNFMTKYTSFQSIDDFFDKSPFKADSNEDFDNIPEDKLDEYVKNNTKFSSWEKMKGTAGEEYITKQLGF